MVDTSQSVSTNVDHGSEHVGISNEKMGEIPIRRKSKVSERADHPLRVSRPLSRGQLEQAMDSRLNIPAPLASV